MPACSRHNTKRKPRIQVLILFEKSEYHLEDLPPVPCKLKCRLFSPNGRESDQTLGVSKRVCNQEECPPLAVFNPCPSAWLISSKMRPRNETSHYYLYHRAPAPWNISWKLHRLDIRILRQHVIVLIIVKQSSPSPTLTCAGLVVQSSTMI